MTRGTLFRNIGIGCVLIILSAVVTKTILVKYRTTRYEGNATLNTSADSSQTSLPRNAVGIREEFDRRIKAHPIISADVGTPLDIVPIPAAQVIHNETATIMEFSITGPKGKGGCRAMYVAGPASADKQEHFALVWTFNGQVKNIPLD